MFYTKTKKSSASSLRMTVKITTSLIIISAFSFLLLNPSAASAARIRCTLNLNVTPSSAIATVGGNTTYAYTLKNTGARQCNDTRISVYYDRNESFVSSNPSPSGRGQYNWYVGSLQSGEIYTLTLTTKNKLKNDSVINNEACASATGSRDSCASTTVTVTTSNTTTPATTAPPIVIPPVVSTTTPPIIKPLSSPELGVWVWDSPSSMSPAKAKQVIDSAVSNGFNVIYLTIDDYLTIDAMPAGTAKTNALSAYNNSLNQFVTYANQRNIAVDAEAGWRDWAETSQKGKAEKILDFVIAYNSTHDAKFRNVQYDVEPYLLPTYETNKLPVLTNYVNMVGSLVARNNSNIGITMVIPHFYGAEGWTPNVNYNGKSATTFKHLLEILDSKPNNMISIMAYRNFAAGNDGTIEISKEEVTMASQTGHRTKIIVAQETGDVPPSYVTFFGMTKAALFGQINLINNYFANSSGFGGIAIHYIDPFLALR